jgi:hypothetical protein
LNNLVIIDVKVPRCFTYKRQDKGVIEEGGEVSHTEQDFPTIPNKIYLSTPDNSAQSVTGDIEKVGSFVHREKFVMVVHGLLLIQM